MPVLPNTRKEDFAQEIAKGHSGREAHRLAGYSAKSDHVRDSSASRMLGEVEVQARVAELKERAARKVELGRADVINMLLEDRQLARQLGQASAAIKAAELLGREMAGMFIDRKEVGKPGEFSRMSEDELRDFVSREAAELGLGSKRVAGSGGTPALRGKPH